jgi:hydroxyacylglutathione hydrolase
LSGEKEGKSPKGVMGLLFRLMRGRLKYRPVKADILLNDGDIIGDYQVVHCPGHTEGSIALYHPTDTIFVGDALRVDLKGNPGPPRSGVTPNMRQAMDSVKKISQLEFNTMLPGHVVPVTSGASHRVKASFAA